MKPVEYLNLVRVEQACALIRKGEQSIEDICYEVGYQTPSTFNRNFKIVMGVSPSVFKSMKGTATPLSMFNISAEKGWEGFQFLPIE
jgi:AraC-like DNA-binding protein